MNSCHNLCERYQWFGRTTVYNTPPDNNFIRRVKKRRVERYEIPSKRQNPINYHYQNPFFIEKLRL